MQTQRPKKQGFPVFSRRRLNTLLSRAVNFARLANKPRHWKSIRTARRVIDRLAEMEREGAAEPQILAYLRQVDSEVFEEIILDLYERQGHIVLRNTRYTGDGGVDGRVYFPTGLAAIQCKRYCGHINPRHVREFAYIADQFPGGGIFVHTGTTGEASYQAIAKSNVTLVSGFTLARMAAGGDAPAFLRKSLMLRSNERG